MSSTLSKYLATAAGALAIASPALAQSRSAITTVEVDAAVAARAATSRSAVSEYFTTDQARAAARQLGLTPEDVSARIASLDQAGIDRVNQQILAGGGRTTIIISTTTIIIVLLILILVTN